MLLFICYAKKYSCVLICTFVIFVFFLHLLGHKPHFYFICLGHIRPERGRERETGKERQSGKERGGEREREKERAREKDGEREKKKERKVREEEKKRERMRGKSEIERK